MKILVTGFKGFVGKNLCFWLKNSSHEVLGIDVDNQFELDNYIKQCDFIIHLAGVNRPLNNEEFYDGNTNFTKKLVDKIKDNHREDVPLIYTSSIQAEKDNDYGKSKLQAENYLFSSGLKVYIYRLSNVFGKWCKPNYNSAVSTFIYNLIRGLPISVSNPKNVINLVYIDDICKEFVNLIENKIIRNDKSINTVEPIYHKTIEEIISKINSFIEIKNNLYLPSNEDEFDKKLYSTYLSYLPIDKFSYPLNMHKDNRGSFTEIFKTDFNGQVSVNIIKKGITKGNHYHHSKNEKFLVVKGTCSTRFRKIDDNEIIEYITSGDKLEVIDIPTGYTHSITNVGEEEAVVIMWANEPFDPNNPDTYFMEVNMDGK